MQRILAALCFLGLIAFAVPLRAAPPVTSWTAIAAKVAPAVVNIEVQTISKAGKPHELGERQQEVGSGFIIDPSGIIVTNKHVIEGAFQITVTLQDGTELPGRVIAAAKLVDLAVLKIDAGHPLPVLHLAPPDAVRPGDPVLAIGNPEGVGTSFSSGIVSGVDRDLMKTPFDDYVQTDAAINHGNSGGPLVDAAGQVVGVDTILLTNLPNEGSNGLGFAISAEVVGAVVRHILDPNGAAVGWIGTQIQDLTPPLAAAFGLGHRHGFLVGGIDKDSPASEAGLRPGDVILSLDGLSPAPRTAREAMGAIATAPVGSKLGLDIWRHGATKRIPVTVRAWPNLMAERGSMGLQQGAIIPVRSPDLGMLLARLTPTARAQYGLGAAEGVLVVAVDKQSDAHVRGVAAGDVIEAVDGQAVATPDQVYRMIRASAQAGRGFLAILLRWKGGKLWIPLRLDGAEMGEAIAGAAHTPAGMAASPAAAKTH
ncbi:MAG: trypsin-like peptidase domain-containing protein [Rhodospirillales bacterium]|nr:trypsin-like peptidase domain-containing protein [Rhodospirillales bacterium]